MSPEETDSISSFLCIHPSIVRIARKHKRTNQELRVLLSIYMLKDVFPTVSRLRISTFTYLWYKVVHANVLRLIESGYLIEVLTPKRNLILSDSGLSIVNDILDRSKEYERQLNEGPKVLNKPPKVLNKPPRKR